MANVTHASPNLKRTPLYDIHVSAGGRMVLFAGWELPVRYSSILSEVRAVRSSSGLFDVSHMGRLRFSGHGASSFLNRFLSVDVPELSVGQGRYHVVCNHEGGIIDDALVYRLGEERFLLIVNASNLAAVLDWITPHLAQWEDVRLENVSTDYAMIAFQGPLAMDVLEEVTPADLQRLRPFRCVETFVAGKDVLLCRTGYTGEDGFELILASRDAEATWRLLADRGAKPCGLGARDVLRLEAGLLLHGNDMDASVNPFEAGLDRFVDLEKDDYIPGPALRRIRERGISRKLVGLETLGRGIARHGSSITDNGKPIGKVTSGTYSPTLDKSIGLGYVPPEYASRNTRLQVDIRSKPIEAQVVSVPFYSKRRKRRS